MGRVARTANRSTEYVASQCRDGLLPGSLVPLVRQGQAVILPPDVAAALVPVFAARLPSPALPALMREHPEQVLEAAAGLAALARLSMEGRAVRDQP